MNFRLLNESRIKRLTWVDWRTARLDVAGMKTLLLKLDCMQRIARGEHAVAED